jgi:hypothetical protein
MSYRFSETEVQDALAVVGQGMAKNYKIRVIWHDGKRVCADVERGIVKLPRLACASTLGLKNVKAQDAAETARNLTRANSGHEFGHCAKTKLTPAEKPTGTLFKITNALEDVRMEREVGNDYPGYRQIFQWANTHHNKAIAGEIIDGKVQGGTLWEALAACIIQSQGTAPAWTLKGRAKEYFDVAYPDFVEVLTAKSTRDCLAIAKKIFANLKDLLEEEKKEQKKKQQEKKEQEQKEQEQKEQEQGEGEGKGKGEGEEGEKGESKDSDKGEKGEPETGNDSGEGEDSDANDSGEGDEGDESEGEGDKSEDKGDEGEDDDDKGDKADESEGKDGDKSGEDDDKGDESEGKDGDEGDEDDESEESEEESGEGEGEGDEDSDDESGDESGNSKSNGKAGNETDKAEGEDETGDGADDGEEADTELTPEEKAEIENQLEADADGKDMTERGNDEIEAALEDVETGTKGDLYTSRRDMDEHTTPEITDESRKVFTKIFDAMQSEVAAMTMALEQALRAITRCRKESYLRGGRLDNDRLVEIAKNLSKNIFYQNRPGRKLSTAVSLVIDQSGSMGNIYQIRDLAILLGECMYRLNIPFEITGTTTKYGYGGAPELDGFSRTNPIIYDHFKQFEEQWPVVRARMMTMDSRVHNIDGEAVEFAARRLLARKEERKILFSLCDGEPCGGQGNDDVLGENIKRVANSARLMGVETYGVSIHAKGPINYYGKENCIVIESGDNIGEKFVRSFAGILTHGEVKL